MTGTLGRVPLIENIEEQGGQKPEEVLTDSGYCSEENLLFGEAQDHPMVATEKGST